MTKPYFPAAVQLLTSRLAQYAGSAVHWPSFGLAWLALVAACAGEGITEWSPVELRTLTPQLPDRSTATGAEPPLLWARSNWEYSSSHVPSPSAVAAVQKQVTLVTWPELEPVATAAEVTETIPPFEVSPRTALRLVPTQPLQPRWYAIRAALPNGWAAPVELLLGSWFAGPGGVSLARFHPGHHPVLRRLMLGAKGGKVAVTLVASEAVTGAPLPLTVRQGSQTLACETNGSGGVVLSVICPVLNETQPFAISLTQDALSSDGQPLRLMSGDAPGPWLVGAGQNYKELNGTTYVVP